jgi:hypothetical protein
MTEKETVHFSGILANEQTKASCEGVAVKTTIRNGLGAPVAAEFSRIQDSKGLSRAC